MALSRTEIVNRSNEKRGIRQKGFKLPLEVIAEIERLSQQHGIPQNQLIIQAVECFKRSKGS
ncbi:ribbon-helix-helix protein, CopG family [Lonepinella koalarum]|uniref:ribbon-helix-helix protein, CopG family n=1 Tax=Lonepinella koalarum TaxID=53417 RepID=UPI003F6E16CC